MSKENLQKNAQDFLKTNRIWGIIISILMVLVGVALLWRPVIGLIRLEYVAIACVGIVGIYLIIKYISMPKGEKVGWVLANGILLVLLSILYMFSSPFVTALTFSFFFAVVSLSDGIDCITVASKCKNEGHAKPGYLIASGVLDIILSIFFIIAPISMNWAMAVILSIYLIISGIILFIRSCSNKG